MLHRATPDMIPEIQAVYAEAGQFALDQGSTNKWDMNTPYCQKLIDEGELFYSGDESRINGAVRLTTATNPLEWPNGHENRLFIAKLATSDAVRGTGYFPRVMLPEIEQEAAQRGMEGTALNCFEDEGLTDYYKACGYICLGTVSFESPRIGTITTAKFIKPLPSAV